MKVRLLAAIVICAQACLLWVAAALLPSMEEEAGDYVIAIIWLAAFLVTFRLYDEVRDYE